MRIFCWLSHAFGSTTLLVPVLMIQNGRPTATRLILAKLGWGWGWSQWLIQGLLFCLPILISLPLALMISHCVNAINIDGFTKKTTDKRSFKIMASNKQAPVDTAKYISWLHKRHTWRVYLFQKCSPKKIKFFYFKLIFVRYCFQIILIFFKNIILIYFRAKNTLKSNHYHTAKHPWSQANYRFIFEKLWKRKYGIIITNYQLLNFGRESMELNIWSSFIQTLKILIP